MKTDIEKIKETLQQISKPKGVINFFENCEKIKMLTLAETPVGFDMVFNGYHYIYYLTSRHKISVEISENDIRLFEFENDLYFYKFLKSLKDRIEKESDTK